MGGWGVGIDSLYGPDSAVVRKVVRVKYCWRWRGGGALCFDLFFCSRL